MSYLKEFEIAVSIQDCTTFKNKKLRMAPIAKCSMDDWSLSNTKQVDSYISNKWLQI